MEVIISSPNTAFDDLVVECPDLSWNQVFLIIDRFNTLRIAQSCIDKDMDAIRHIYPNAPRRVGYRDQTGKYLPILLSRNRDLTP